MYQSQQSKKRRGDNVEIKELIDNLNQITNHDEYLIRAQELYEMAMSEKNPSLLFEIANLLFDDYKDNQEYDEAIYLFKNIFKLEIIEESSQLLILVDKLISLLLKTEDFTTLLAILTFRERFIQSDQHQLMMQHFYLAVCYEGLKKYHDAIQVLNQIPDTISQNNIISKYLKLSMLSLKTDQYDDSQLYYKKAVFYDKYQKNSMIHLVESDILYYQGQYQQALEKYQDYFISSKVKNRYLDRYILICIKLGLFDEATLFYQEHEPKIKETISKNYKLQFYEASLLLFELTYQTDRYLYVSEIIQTLNNNEIEVIDQFSGFQNLMTQFYKNSSYETERDILLNLARVFHNTYKEANIYFLRTLDDGHHLYIFKKQLLIEKNLKDDSVNTSFLSLLLKQQITTVMYHKPTILMYENQLGTLFDQFELLICSKIKTPLKAEICFFVTENSPLYSDYINKLVLISSFLLNKAVEDFNNRFILQNESEISRLAMSSLGYHHMRIANGIIIQLSDELRNILLLDETRLPFEEIQRNIIGKKIYLDDFISNNHHQLDYQINDDSTITFDIYSYLIGSQLYLFFKDISNEIHLKNQIQKRYNYLGNSKILSVNALQSVFEEVKEAFSVVYLSIINHEIIYIERSYLYKQTIEIELERLFHIITKDEGIGIYHSTEGGYFLVIKSIDKRVIQRVFNDYIKAIHLLNPMIELSGYQLPVHRAKNYQETIDILFEYYYDYKESNKLVFFERKNISKKHLEQSILIHIDELLASNKMKLAFYPIKNPFLSSIEGYYIQMHPESLFGEVSLIDATIRKSNKYDLFDTLLVKSLIKSIEQSNDSFDKLVIFDIHYQTVLNTSKTIDLVKKLKKIKAQVKDFIIIVNAKIRRINKVIDFFQKEGFKIALSDWNHLKIDEFGLIKNIEFLWITDDNIIIYHQFHHALSQSPIYYHQKREILKSELKELDINLITGNIYSYQENM